MNPLSALSVAAAVVQIVDFGSKLISSSREIYESIDGAVLENSEVEQMANSLLKLTHNLDTSLNQNKLDRELSLNDLNVEHMARECRRLASDLLAALDKLKITDSHQKWRSIRQALVVVWNKERIETLERRLERFRQQLVPTILASLRYEIAFSLFEGVV
jgi:hypothetical protein